MVKWVCYPSNGEPDMWTAWLRAQNVAVKARHAVVMRFLIAGHWQRPHFRPLTGRHVKGLGEIRVGAEVEWRLIGNRNATADTFTLLVICNHKEGIYKPHDTFETAMQRWKEMRGGLKGIELNAHPG